jgi:circadian clock protein KaiB
MFSRPSNCSFRLYVSARSASSLRAIDTVRLLVRADDVFEVIDVAEHPERAEADRVLATPMLLKLEPLPRQRVIGDLLDLGRLRQALGLEQRESAA